LESVRFEKFTLLIDGIHKSISKLKFDTAPYLGVKSVHVFWVYELSLHPDGLTAAEIAAVSMVDRSLISREIAALKKDGYVECEDTGKKRNYNARITLTEKGRELAEKITEEAIYVQSMVDVGITKEELVSFYSTLEKLYANFSSLASGERPTLKEDN
jgi:DNA-binding MarR family transcriptional regulator